MSNTTNNTTTIKDLISKALERDNRGKDTEETVSVAKAIGKGIAATYKGTKVVVKGVHTTVKVTRGTCKLAKDSVQENGKSFFSNVLRSLADSLDSDK